MRLYDSHCHLTWEIEGDPAAARIERAGKQGVEAMLTVAIDLASARHGRALQDLHPCLLASVGIHPNDVGPLGALEQSLAELGSLAAQGGWAAIGETGLDFYRDRTEAAVQESALIFHLELATRLDLPLILHCREAAARLLQVLEAAPGPLRGVMHCFSQGPEWVAPFVELGLHVSFAGNLTYPKSGALREAAALVPSDRLLVETDAPFLAPQAHRGRRNEPAFVLHTAECLAELRGVSLEELAEQTWNNAVDLFGAPASFAAAPDSRPIQGNPDQ